jgi:hypothetical protein
VRSYHNLFGVNSSSKSLKFSEVFKGIDFVTWLLTYLYAILTSCRTS